MNPVAEPAEASPGCPTPGPLMSADAFDRLRHRKSPVAESAKVSPVSLRRAL